MLRIAQVFLHLIALCMFSSWSYGQQKCIELYSSQNETAALIVSGRVQSPHNLQPYSVLYIEKNIRLGSQREFVMVDTLPDGDGFLPTASDMIALKRYHEVASGYQLGLGTIHQRYAGRLTEAELKAVIAGDWKNLSEALNSHRLGYISVKSEPQKLNDYQMQQETKNDLKGFLRVHDGTDYRKLGIDTAQTESSFEMPSESLLAVKGIKTQVFDDYRSQGYQIFELGKYYIDPDLSPNQLKFVRNELFKWLIKNYLISGSTASDKVVFVIDVGSKVTARAYRILFGARELSIDLFMPALKSPDSILVVDQKILLERLQKIILN